MRKNDKTHPQKLSQHKDAGIEEINYENMINSLLENDDISNLSYINLLRINEIIPIYQTHCLKQKKYQKAKQILDLQTKITLELTKQTKQLHEYNEKNAITTEFASVQTNKEKKTPELKRFDYETQQKENQMKNRQRQVFNQFEELWKTKVSAEYSHDSRQLQSLKQEHKKLYSIGLRANAADVQEQISHLEEEEANESQKKFEQDYKKAKIRLFEKFETEKISFRKERQMQRFMLMSRIQRNVPITRPKARLASIFSYYQSNSSLSKSRPVKRSESRQSSVLSSYSATSSSIQKLSSSSSLESTKAVYGIKMDNVKPLYDETSCQANSLLISSETLQSQNQNSSSFLSNNSKITSNNNEEEALSDEIEDGQIVDDDIASYDENSVDDDFLVQDQGVQTQIFDLNTYHDETSTNVNINGKGFNSNNGQGEKFEYEYEYEYEYN